MEISEGEEDDAEWKNSSWSSVVSPELSDTMPPSPPHRVILHFDLDCFYAQVEMIRNPALRDVPLGIQQKYIIVTCNYVARERGVTKLMSLTDAKEKCPELVLVKGEDLTHYRETSYKVTELLMSHSPLVERLGFDENFMDITEMVEKRLAQLKSCSFNGHIYNNDDIPGDKAGIHPWLAIGSQVAAELREAIHSKLGLTGCAGIATNKLLAKLVSGTFKPNQQTTLLPEDVSNMMSSLSSLRKVPGIGYQTAKRLQVLGLTSLKDLELFPLDNLVREFGGPSARRMKNLVVGIDDSPVNPTGAPQSLSDEDSFKKISSTKDVMEKIQELLNNLVQRMHKDGRQPQTLRLTIRRYATTNKWFSRESRQCPIPNHISQRIISGSSDEVVVQLLPLAMKLFHKMVDTNTAFHLTLINVCFSNLQARSAAVSGKGSLMSFFTQSLSPRKTQTYSSQTQDDSPYSGGGQGMDRHTAMTQNISKRAATVQFNTSGVEPVLHGSKYNENPFFIVDACHHEQTSCSTLSDGDDSHKAVTHLPLNVDPEVFKCLPEEIQKELLSSASSKSTLYTSTDTLTGNRKADFHEINSLDRPITIIPSGMDTVPGKNIITENKLSFLGSSDCKFPGNVDPTVFAELPPDVQKELMSGWRQDKTILKAPSSKKPAKNLVIKEKKASGKSSQPNNLLKYFKPH